MLPTSEKILLSVEDLNDARTKLADFFSILLENPLECVIDEAGRVLVLRNYSGR